MFFPFPSLRKESDFKVWKFNELCGALAGNDRRAPKTPPRGGAPFFRRPAFPGAAAAAAGHPAQGETPPLRPQRARATRAIMQPDTLLTLWHWCASLLGIAANAAATLPLMAALALILGRRGHAAVCLAGAGALAGLALRLAAAWPLLVLTNAMVQLSLATHAPLKNCVAALFTPAGAGISLSVAVWLCGAACAWLGRKACATSAARLSPAADRYPVRAVRVPLCALLAAAFCALAAFALKNWPFAGPPPGMDLWRVAGAVGKHACRSYFLALTAGGAVGLLLAAAVARKRAAAPPGLPAPDPAETAGAVRWCALWAVAGAVPHLLERWGLTVGVWLRGDAAPPPGNPHAAAIQVAALGLLTLAVAAWAAILAGRQPLRRLPLARAGMALLLLAASAPWALALI